MKKVIILLFIPYLLICDEEPSIPLTWWDVHPVHVGGNAIWIGRADIEDEGGDLYFRKSNAYVSLLIPLSKTTFFTPRVEWDNFTMDWNKNPKFHETNFNYMQFGLLFFSMGLDNWRWILRANYNIDVDHFNHPGTYSLFSFLIWGRYELHRKWHYHVGAFATIGMEAAPVYPVIGLDFSPNKCWTFEAIFPIMYSIQYHIDKNWRVSLAGRPLKERFRVASKEPQPRSVFCYSTIGAELNVRYERFLRMEIEAYAGYNFGGSFYIKNRYGHHALYTDVQGAPYAGVGLDYGF